MTNFSNTQELMSMARKFDLICDKETQEYAVKFLLGEKEVARRQLQKLREGGRPLHHHERRIDMLNKAIGTIANDSYCTPNPIALQSS